MVEISFEERKKIQLDMLREIDSFCRENKIKYSLAYGTLLGAIRHGGYIPWDDDVDIFMTFPDILKFRSLFKSEKLQYCDIETVKHYEYAFSRIAFKPTYSKTGLLATSYGINIDLYALVGIPENNDEAIAFINKGESLRKDRLHMLKWRSRILRFLPITNIPGFDRTIKKYYSFITSFSFNESKRFICLGMPELQYSYNYNILDRTVDVSFEGLKLMAIKDWDFYLRQRYGDYMTPPPPEQRVPYHGGHYYWKKIK